MFGSRDLSLKHKLRQALTNTHTHTHTHTHTRRCAQIHTVTHRYTWTRTDTHRCSQIHTDTHRFTLMRTDTHGHAQIHTDAHRHSQAHTHTHLHLRTIPFSLQLQVFVAHRAHTAASIGGDAHAMRIEAVPQPLRPRGRFDFETFGTQSPKSFELKAASRPKKQRPGAKSKISSCTSLGGGAKKRTASSPLQGGNTAVTRVHAPSRPGKFCQHHPLWRGQCWGFAGTCPSRPGKIAQHHPLWRGQCWRLLAQT